MLDADKTMSKTTTNISGQTKKAGTAIKKETDQVSKKMGGLNKTIANVGKTLVGAFAARAVYRGISNLVTGLGEKADRLLDLQDITGIATDKLQEYEYVARIAGVSTEALARASEGLTRRMSNATSEASPFNRAMADLGITVRTASGELRGGDKIMDDIIGTLAEMENVTERNMIGQQAFGGAWRDMAPILSLGAKGIEELRQEAHDMGVVLDGEALESANEFRQGWVRVGQQFDAVKNQIGLDLIPVIQSHLIPAAEWLGRTVARLANFIGNINEAQVTWIKRIAAVTAGIYAFNKSAALMRAAVIGITRAKVAATAATNAFTVALKKNPIGLVATLLAGGASAMLLYRNRTKQATDQQNAFNQSLDDLHSRRAERIWVRVAFDIPEAEGYMDDMRAALARATQGENFDFTPRSTMDFDRVFNIDKLRENIQNLSRDDLATLATYLQRHIEDANRRITNMLASVDNDVKKLSKSSRAEYDKISDSAEQWRKGLDYVIKEQDKLNENSEETQEVLDAEKTRWQELNSELEKWQNIKTEATSARMQVEAESRISAIQREISALLGLERARQRVLSESPDRMPTIQPGADPNISTDFTSGFDPDYLNFLKEYQQTLDDIGIKHQAFGDSFDAVGYSVSAVEQGINTLIEDFDMTPADEELQVLIGALNRLNEAQETASQGFSHMESIARGALEGMAASFVDMAFGAKQSIRDVIKSMIRMIAMQLASAAIGGIFGGFGFSRAAGSVPDIGALMADVRGAIPQMAAGGIVKGETLVNVGEYPGASINPEVIAPLDKLKDIMASAIYSDNPVPHTPSAQTASVKSGSEPRQFEAYFVGGMNDLMLKMKETDRKMETTF